MKDFIPIPDLMNAQKVLVLVPHPDDAELVAGGTIAMLTTKGVHVEYVIASDGSRGGFDPTISEAEMAAVRRKEQAQAARILGVEHITWLGFQDTEAPAPNIVRKPIISLLRKIQPDFVITIDPWLPYEGHPDHRQTSMAAVEACLFSSLPMVQMEDLANGLTPWQVTGIALALSPKPNTFINVEDTWEKKIQSLKCHESQFPQEIWDTFYPIICLKSQEYGKAIGAEKAEAFKVLTAAHLHVMPDTWNC